MKHALLFLFICTSVLTYGQGCFTQKDIKYRKTSSRKSFKANSYKPIKLSGFRGAFFELKDDPSYAIGVDRNILNGFDLYVHNDVEMSSFFYLSNEIGLAMASTVHLKEYGENFNSSKGLGAYLSSSPRIYLSNAYFEEKGESTENFPGAFVGLKLALWYLPSFKYTQVYYATGANLGYRAILGGRLMLEANLGFTNSNTLTQLYYSEGEDVRTFTPELNGKIAFFLF